MLHRSARDPPRRFSIMETVATSRIDTAHVKATAVSYRTLSMDPTAQRSLSRFPGYRNTHLKGNPHGNQYDGAKKDGSQSYTATVRKKQKGKVVLTLTETVPNERSAKRWTKQRKSELKTKGAVDKVVQAKKRKTWSDVIADYCAASPSGFGKTKTANLAYPLGDAMQTVCYDLLGNVIDCPAEGEELFGAGCPKTSGSSTPTLWPIARRWVWAIPANWQAGSRPRTAT
ncbi:MAG: hypothetical protein ACRBBV_13660 [Paracoccaceae bacterium]